MACIGTNIQLVRQSGYVAEALAHPWPYGWSGPLTGQAQGHGSDFAHIGDLFWLHTRLRGMKCLLVPHGLLDGMAAPECPIYPMYC